MRNRKKVFNLTKEIEETKQKKWLLRQKFKLVNKLRKHGGYLEQAKMRNQNSIGGNNAIQKTTYQERSKSSMENSNKNTLDINTNHNMIDASVATGPDVLSMLAQLK